MSLLRRIGWLRGTAFLAVVTVLALTVFRLCAHALPREPEIALVIGEPWEDMRKRSSAIIDPAISGHAWGRMPKSDASLRLADPQYGFVTPLSRFFTVGFDDGRVNDVRMSPQIEPLPLDDALTIVLDLQDQWRKAGWKSIRVKDNPPFVDTPEWRTQLRDVNKGGTAFWQAGNRYQAMLILARFKDEKHPNEERYLITLALAKPWMEP
jgi:hypothetical protein